MIKVVIIEDELPASEMLKKYIEAMGSDFVVEKILHDKATAITYLKSSHPDLLMLDINLTDGNSMDIFKAVDVKCPVVFITAYDTFWQEAFELNSIDYMLKPVSFNRLKSCLEKYKNFKQYFSGSQTAAILSSETGVSENYKKRFLIKKPNELIVISVEDAVCFFSSNKLTFVVDYKNNKHILDFSLSDLEQLLEPEMFFRVNRQVIVNRNSIQKIKTIDKGRLELELSISMNEGIHISQENVAAFKKWLD